MSGESPVMSKRIDHLAVTVSPEHGRYRHGRLSTGTYRLVEQGIRVLHVKIDARRRERLLVRGSGHPWKLISQENNGITDLKFGVVDPPVGRSHTKSFDGAKRGLIKSYGP